MPSRCATRCCARRIRPAATAIPHPVIHDDLRPDWAEHDLSGLAEQARQLRLEVLAQRQFRQPFDLTKDSPLRIAAARVGADELMLLFTAHHIAWDDGSWAPFFTDLIRAYTDADSAAPAPRLRPRSRSAAVVQTWPTGAR